VTQPSQTIAVCVASPRLRFSAAHFICFEDGTREPLHGHDYRLTIELRGRPSGAGLVFDFLRIEDIVCKLLRPLDHRVLLPTDSALVQVTRRQDEIEITAAGKRLSLPAEDCCLLPVPNTTAENLVVYLGTTIRTELWNARDFPRAAAEELRAELFESDAYSAAWRGRFGEPH